MHEYIFINTYDSNYADIVYRAETYGELPANRCYIWLTITLGDRCIKKSDCNYSIGVI